MGVVMAAVRPWEIMVMTAKTAAIMKNADFSRTARLFNRPKANNPAAALTQATAD
ncbi:unnamed protein product [marine sediment metagenome]|uniref:Uncharacterized protein n=1 Tax=marine sediment metagenome TaxID=412755 RepID=X1MRF1_9ZZZZ